MSRPTQYNRAAVTLHWLIAGLIFLLLFLGTVFLAPQANDDIRKVEGLIGHSLVGVFVALLTVLRLINLRWRGHPDAPAGTTARMAQAARAGYLALYALVFGIIASGLAMAWQVDLLALFTGKATLPPTFQGLAARAVHGALTTGLMAMIALHMLAALYHQIVLKDGLLRRMAWRRLPR